MWRMRRYRFFKFLVKATHFFKYEKHLNVSERAELLSFAHSQPLRSPWPPRTNFNI